MRSERRLRVLVGAVLARRRWLAALAAAAAAAVALEVLAPPPPPAVPVVVASRPLAAGQQIAADDLVVADWPEQLVPDQAHHDASVLVGRTVASAVGSGEPVTSLRLVGSAVVSTLPDGQVAAPVRLADAAAASLLGPGDRVDLIAASAGSADPVGGLGPGGARTVATDAVVLAVPGSESQTWAADSGPVGLVVVAVSRSEALAVAAASVLGPLSVVLVG